MGYAGDKTSGIEIAELISLWGRLAQSSALLLTLSSRHLEHPEACLSSDGTTILVQVLVYMNQREGIFIFNLASSGLAQFL